MTLARNNPSRGTPTTAMTLAAMHAAGLTLATAPTNAPAAGDHIYLTTTDPELARKFDMHEESEFLTP